MTGDEPEHYALLELRTYRLAAGKREAFEQRLREVTLPIYARLGLRCDGFWASDDEPLLTYYTLYWTSQAEREDGWRRLLADPEFVASREGYDSPVIESTVQLLRPIV
ncbi:NIPSNAP family protein [Cnuibacter physcomitrellae]|nr:NIPSNAP family protein [Cnuibacter physcomitrellae]